MAVLLKECNQKNDYFSKKCHNLKGRSMKCDKFCCEKFLNGVHVCTKFHENWKGWGIFFCWFGMEWPLYASSVTCDFSSYCRWFSWGISYTRIVSGLDLWLSERHYYMVYQACLSLVKQMHCHTSALIRVCMHFTVRDTLTFMDFCTRATTTFRNCVMYYVLCVLFSCY